MALIFSDTTDLEGVIQEMESNLFNDNYGFISGNTNRLKTATRYANKALDDYVSLALRGDTRWQFDDTEHSDYPVGTMDLVADQNDYPILVPLSNGPTGQTSITPLKIEQVEVMNAEGDYYRVYPIDEKDYSQPLSEVFDTSGLPRYYDKNQSSVWLWPAPRAADVTATAGLRVKYQRLGKHFAYTDTTRQLGILSNHHDYIPLKASYYWARNKRMEAKDELLRDVNIMEAGIVEDFIRRDKDDQLRITVRRTMSR